MFCCTKIFLSYLYIKIRFRTDVYHLNLRHRVLLDLQLCNTEMGKFRFTHLFSFFYHSLHQFVKQCPNYRFCGKLKEHLFDNQVNPCLMFNNNKKITYTYIFIYLLLFLFVLFTVTCVCLGVQD